MNKSREEQIAALTQAHSYLQSVFQAADLANDVLKRINRQDLLFDADEAHRVVKRIQGQIDDLRAERDAEGKAIVAENEARHAEESRKLTEPRPPVDDEQPDDSA